MNLKDKLYVTYEMDAEIELDFGKPKFNENGSVEMSVEVKSFEIDRIRVKEEPEEVPYKVICLCGSTKYKKEFLSVTEQLTLDGNIVISVGVFGHADGIELSESQKEELDKIHFSKIDMSDEIRVINVNGYIGTSTQREISYAKANNKKVTYYEEELFED